MPGITPEPVMKIAMGFMAAKFFFAANEIGLFEALAIGPASLGELATWIAVPSRTTAIVAAAMVSLGLIEQEEGRYRNSAEAAAFLSGGPGFDLRMALRFWNGINYPMWQRLEEAVRAGQANHNSTKWISRNSRCILLASRRSQRRSLPRSRLRTTLAVIDACST